MKHLIFFSAAVLFLSCKEQKKVSVEKLTDTAVKDSVIVRDTMKLAAAAPVVAVNDTIVPGERVAHISLNEKTEEVIKALGKPDAEDAAMGKAMLTWYSKPSMKNADTVKNSIIIYTTTNFGGKDEAARASHIRITSPFFKTEEGVGCGSTIAFIKIKYPVLKKPAASYTDKNGEEVMIFDDKEDGIAFEIRDSKCVGITVHRPGTKAWETYIALFGDVDAE